MAKYRAKFSGPQASVPATKIDAVLQANVLPTCICKQPCGTADQRGVTIAIAQPASSLSLQLFVTMFSSFARRNRRDGTLARAATY
jgi:hypothetical protein